MRPIEGGKRRIGIDVGGTFTDVVSYNEETKQTQRVKSLSIPNAPEQGIVSAFQQAGVAMQDVSSLLQGTTVVTNLIIERKGARVGLITTNGFRDVLEIMRAGRARLYDLQWVKPAPFIPRPLRLEVTERMNASGDVVTPLDIGSVHTCLLKLCQEGVEAIAVCLLHSYVNSLHEEQIRDIAKELVPEIPICISSDVCREIREYERTSTTVLNAYATPRVNQYVDRLKKSLTPKNGIKYMNSEGGLIPHDEVKKLPITLCLSGPAGGVLASTFLGKTTGLKNLITMDMGGTSLDVALIVDGEYKLDSALDVEWGIPIKAAAIDVRTIGAGGGSIVSIDGGGAVRVGPDSAGAIPGPACYDNGGTGCTVTDSNLILGILDASSFASGSLKLRKDMSLKAIAPIAAELGVSCIKAAEGIYRVVNANMSAAIRQLTVENGIDPRDFTLIAYGGAGGQHAVSVAREVGIENVIIPSMPSVFSALGMIVANMRQSRSQSLFALVDEQGLSEARKIFEQLERDALERLSLQSDVTRTAVRRELDLKYDRQAHEIRVELLDGDSPKAVQARFVRLHEQLHGTRLEHSVRIVAVRTTIVGEIEPIEMVRHEQASCEASPTRHADLLLHEGTVPVFSRANLKAGNRLPSPCLIEEVDTVHYIPEACTVQIDDWLNIRVTIKV